MEAFVWSKQFETGLDLVDRQHRQLVDTINQLGERMLAGQSVADEQLQLVFHQLAEYGRHHFHDEEALSAESGVDARHRDQHAAHHRQFFEQLLSLWHSRASLNHPAETIHGFLAAWLTVHILGADQAMARQIWRIRDGESSAAAYEAEQKPVDASSAVLLAALNRLYSLLAEQNKNLAQANLGLELRVSARTEELAAANTRLENEQAELTALLRKVESAQQQLLQSEKMAAIGQLAAGVAHEINNPIGFVNSNLGTLKTYVGRMLKLIDTYEKLGVQGDKSVLDVARGEADIDFLREDLPDLLEESQGGLRRVTKIVQDLKDFSHVDQSEHQLADLNAAMESTLNVVWSELKYKAEVVRELGDIPEVDCVPAQINQVFMNLLVNAAQAIEKTGRITVRSGFEAEQVWFEVADTGKGMAEEVKKRIFEPFYTTKPIGKGTGLGLSISYDIIVKKHGGRIDVTSEPGFGTCFRLWLPLCMPA
jgi:two-component system, NtrC family, sensor kinase